MNIFQIANGAASFLIFGALVSGLSAFFNNANSNAFNHLSENQNIIYLFLFILVFRIKTFFDDHKHFGEEHQDKNFFRFIGFILAVISWVIWGVAATVIQKITLSRELMAWGILISTLWIIIHLFEILADKNRKRKEAFISLLREKWIYFNLAYIFFLFPFIECLNKNIPIENNLSLIFLLFVLLFDIISSKSFNNILTDDIKD